MGEFEPSRRRRLAAVAPEQIIVIVPEARAVRVRETDRPGFTEIEGCARYRGDRAVRDQVGIDRRDQIGADFEFVIEDVRTVVEAKVRVMRQVDDGRRAAGSRRSRRSMKLWS